MDKHMLLNSVAVTSMFLSDYYDVIECDDITDKLIVVDFNMFIHYTPDYNASLEFNRIMYEILLTIGYDETMYSDYIDLGEFINYEVRENTFSSPYDDNVIEMMEDNAVSYVEEIHKQNVGNGYSLSGGLVIRWITGLKCYLIPNWRY